MGGSAKNFRNFNINSNNKCQVPRDGFFNHEYAVLSGGPCMSFLFPISSKLRTGVLASPSEDGGGGTPTHVSKFA